MEKIGETLGGRGPIRDFRVGRGKSVVPSFLSIGLSEPNPYRDSFVGLGVTLLDLCGSVGVLVSPREGGDPYTLSTLL